MMIRITICFVIVNTYYACLMFCSDLEDAWNNHHVFHDLYILLRLWTIETIRMVVKTLRTVICSGFDYVLLTV